MKDEIPKMTEVEQEERKTVFENLSREIGFLGVSLLHRLNALYGFDVLQDHVFDAMHLVSLNIVKRRVQYWLSNGILDREEFGERLKRMPWSTGTVCFFFCLLAGKPKISVCLSVIFLQHLASGCVAHVNN